jgi:hypothetical protein
MAFPKDAHTLSPAPGIFAVRARTMPEHLNEPDAVGVAVRELLSALDPRVTRLYLHLPSAGGTVPPIYGFIEAVRAFGRWPGTKQRRLHLIAHVGPQVLLNLTSRQIGLCELLSSTLVRFWAVVNFEAGRESARRVLYKSPECTLRDVLIDLLGQLDDQALAAWSVSICPSPKRDPEPLTGPDLGRKLFEVGVVFGSVVVLARPSARSAVTHA